MSTRGGTTCYDKIMKSSVERRRSIVAKLSEMGVCVRCTVRLLGCRTVDVYSSTASAQQFIDDLCCRETVSIGSICVSCLGIMQDLCDNNNIESIVKQVKDAAYVEPDTFLFSLSVPAALQIRQHSMILSVKELFPDVYGDENCLPSVKDSWKWVFGPVVEDQLGMAFNVQGGLDITVNILYDDNATECDLLRSCESAAGRLNQKRDKCFYSRLVTDKLLTTIDDESFKRVFHCPPTLPLKSCYYGSMSFVHCPLYIAGRYNKYSRKISQTPWIVDGVKLMEHSVQELICGPLSESLQADEIRFSSSGREDVDVRTLGKGRPFLLHVVNPRRTKFRDDEMKQLQEKINQRSTDIGVRHLQVVSKEDTAKLKEGEEEKRKSYTALCNTALPIEQPRLECLNRNTDLELLQKTPIRVLHRRTASVRKKVVHSMRAEIVDAHHFKLNLVTQAGTYIKEFVHGDFGRTVPNLCLLLANEVDIEELDVESIELNWPPEV